jgi:hypothetical protein
MKLRKKINILIGTVVLAVFIVIVFVLVRFIKYLGSQRIVEVGTQLPVGSSTQSNTQSSNLTDDNQTSVDIIKDTNEKSVCTQKDNGLVICK